MDELNEFYSKRFSCSQNMLSLLAVVDKLWHPDQPMRLIVSTNRVFHDLSATQERQYCQFRFGHAIQN